MDIFIKKCLDMNVHIDKKRSTNRQRTLPQTHGQMTLPASFSRLLNAFSNVLFGLRPFRYPNNQYSIIQYDIQTENKR